MKPTKQDQFLKRKFTYAKYLQMDSRARSKVLEESVSRMIVDKWRKTVYDFINQLGTVKPR